MMEGGAFGRLNAGRSGVESLNQAKSGLAGLPTIRNIDGNRIREVSKLIHAEVLLGQISTEYG
jgi:hypothetical protein